MNENFDACFMETEKWEGWHKFTNDPRDPGGATESGLTQNVYNGWCRTQHFPISSVKNASDATIKSIFKIQFWDSVRGDDLWPGVDLMMFDRAINEGPIRPIKGLQRILNVTVDGQFGLETLDALQMHPAHSTILLALHNDRLSFWRSLGRLWRIFGPGWTNREKDIYTVAQKMMYTHTS